MVIADDPYRAEDAAENVSIDFDPVLGHSTVTAATAAGARQIHDELTGNQMLDLQMFDDPRLGAIFDNAPVVVFGVFSSARVAALPLEGRACLAEWDDRDQQLVVHLSTQVPHQVRSGIAEAIGVAEHSVRVVAPDVGGASGLNALSAAKRLLSGQLPCGCADPYARSRIARRT